MEPARGEQKQALLPAPEADRDVAGQSERAQLRVDERGIELERWSLEVDDARELDAQDEQLEPPVRCGHVEPAENEHPDWVWHLEDHGDGERREPARAPEQPEQRPDDELSLRRREDGREAREDLRRGRDRITREEELAGDAGAEAGLESGDVEAVVDAESSADAGEPPSERQRDRLGELRREHDDERVRRRSGP